MEQRPMAMGHPDTTPHTFEYERPPEPLVFPEGAEVPETLRHLELRTLLFAFLKRAFADRAAIGSEQFVYFRATDPQRCVAPDAFVRMAAKHELFRTWKVWERGAPDVAVEIVSAHERPWSEKLADYREVGVRELVRFDPEAQPGQRLCVWDRVEDDLVPRVVVGDRAPSRVLGGTWCVAPCDDLDEALRLEDARGVIVPTAAEAERAAKEAERVAKEAERAAKEAERIRADTERARADALDAKLAALLAEREGRTPQG